MVLLIDNCASGNIIFDNLSKVAYVSLLKETFLYLVMSVMFTSFHVKIDYIVHYIGLSMTKFVLLMVLCSEIAMHDCKVIPTPNVLFDDYSSCIVYGYDYSYKLMASFDPEWTNSMKAYTKFSCKPDKII